MKLSFSGLPGGGLFRDKVIEIVVRSVKTKLRNLHINLNDQILDKSISSLSTISKIVNHDLRSMCAGNLDLQASYDHIGTEAKAFMKEKIQELDPFSSTRSPISLYDKSKGLSPFTGMTLERANQFTKRNRKNFTRNHPTKEVLDSLDKFRRRNQRNREDAGEEAIIEEVVTNTDIAEEREDELVPEQLLEVREPGQFQAHLQPGQPAFRGHVGMDSLERSHGEDQMLARQVGGEQHAQDNHQPGGANQDLIRPI